MTDASHVRNAIARFDQVQGVTDADRDLAFENILVAAKHYDVDVAETNWRQLGDCRTRRIPLTDRATPRYGPLTG